MAEKRCARHVLSRRGIRIRYFSSVMYSFHRSALETHLNAIATCISVDTRSYSPHPPPPPLHLSRLDYRIISRVSVLCRRNPTFAVECIRRLTAGDIRDWILSSRCFAIVHSKEEKRAEKKKIQLVVTDRA